VIDVYAKLDPASNANTLTSFILGGLTQTQMMRRAQPTFVSVWIGNNDVLGAATSLPQAGDSTKITSVANFQTRYGALLDTVESVGPRGAVLIGVANVTRIPYFSAGATYWAIKNHLAPPDSFPTLFTVSNNCAPVATTIPGARGDSVLVPFPYGLQLLSTAVAGAPANLDCADTVASIVVPSELTKLVTAVTAYNAFISSQATSRGYAYLNPNTILDSLALAGAIPPFPRIFNAAGAFNPCNGTPAKTTPPPLPATPPPFGLFISCDGVHPSGAAHRLIADHLRGVINTAYTTAIPAIP
jgi:lysophospholipase L1-like esterase